MFENVPAWVADYIGIPFREKGRDFTGCDCWGLARLAYMGHRGIELPLYLGQYETTKDGDAIKLIIEIEKQAGLWQQVTTPQPDDFVICTVKGNPWHIGLIVAKNVMLHTESGIDSAMADLTALRWVHHIEGYYRYNE